jgi:signal transduction histidine kinase
MMTMPEASPAIILVVDDNESARYAKMRVLAHAGFDVREASTGAEALRLIREIKPMVALLDLLLPDLSGLDVCRRIKTDPDTSGTLVLAISAALTDSEHRVRGLDSGADGYLVDPISPSELVANVRAQVRVWHREREIRELIRERDELLREAEAARGQAELAVRAKDEFLAVVSHELRNPLNAMIGWLRILSQSAIVPPETFAKAIAVLSRNVDQQRQLIEDLLDTSRVVTGKLKLEIGPVDLVQVAEEAVEVVRSAAVARGVTLRTSVGAAIGPIAGDAARLSQVVWNLLSNAIKFTSAGGVVTLRLEAGPQSVRLVVSDTGQGIAPEFLPHVFELFQQFDSTSTRRFGGLGLGLALTKRLVDLHGGEIRAESGGEGRGATFTVELPVRAQVGPIAGVADISTREWPCQQPAAAPISLAGVRILAIDDEEETCDLLAEILRRSGATAVTVGSGQAAVELLDDPEARFDVLLCDIGMPGQDGYAVIAQIRDLETRRGVRPFERIPAVALTAYTRPQDRLRALQSGFQMHLAKPIEPDELVAMINSLVQARAPGSPTLAS